MSWSHFWSTILGAVISLGTSIMISRYENKNAMQLEKVKLSADKKQKRFSEFLLPAMDLYNSSENFVEFYYAGEVGNIIGSGLKDDYVRKIDELYAKNYNLLDMELHQIYKQVSWEYRESLKDPRVSEIQVKNFNNRNNIDWTERHEFCFDNEQKLYKVIKKQINEIDKAYM